MRMLCSEKISAHKYKTPEGYLLCQNAILSRVGKQTYMKCELYPDTDSTDLVEVDRPAEEVFSDEAMASFEGKPITCEHPEGSVCPENYNELAVGHVSNIRRSKDENGVDVMIGDLLITDPDCIADIENGVRTDLSCGYDTDIKGTDKLYQSNIRGNHVALCEEGRAGCARIIDSKSIKDMTKEEAENTMVSAKNLIKLNGINANILGRPTTNEVRVNAVNIDQLDEVAKAFKKNGFDTYNVDKEFGCFFIKEKRNNSMKDSVSRGTLIQEFGKQGDQYKIVKIEKNTIYAEEVNTGKTVLLKKDKEGIDWDVITKTELNDSIKDTRALLVELEELKEEWDYYDEHNNPQKCLEIEKEIAEVREMLKSGKFTADSLSNKEESINIIKSLLSEVDYKEIKSTKNAITIDFNDKKSLRKAMKLLKDNFDIEAIEDKLYIVIYDKLTKDSNMKKEFTNYYEAKKEADKLGLKLAEYGDIYGSKKSYACWNKTGNRNDECEIYVEYSFDENGKPVKDSENEGRIEKLEAKLEILINKQNEALKEDNYELASELDDKIESLIMYINKLKGTAKEIEVKLTNDSDIDFVKSFLESRIGENKRIRPLTKEEKLPRGFRFLSGTNNSGEVRFNGVNYAYWIKPDGNIKVMTSQEAGSNWSETLYKDSDIKDDFVRFDILSDGELLESFEDEDEAYKELQSLKMNKEYKGKNLEIVKNYINTEEELSDPIIWYFESPTESGYIEMDKSEVPSNLTDYVQDFIDAGYKYFTLYSGMTNAGPMGLLAKVRGGKITDIDTDYDSEQYINDSKKKNSK